MSPSKPSPADPSWVVVSALHGFPQERDMPWNSFLLPGNHLPPFLLQGWAALQGTPLSSMAPVASPETPQLQPHLHGTTLTPGTTTTTTVTGP